MNPDLGEHFRVIKLFFVLPLYGWKTKGGNKTWRILGIPVLKKKAKVGGASQKYYVLGLPVFQKKAKVNGGSIKYCIFGVPVVKVSKKMV